MKFDEWFDQYDPIEPTGIGGYGEPQMRAAYEAGQRDMRERAAALCLDRYHVRSAESDACDELHEEIRAIKLESEQ